MQNVPQTALAGFMASLGSTETAHRIAAFDWSRTPLGAIDGWPQSLRSAVSLMARSPVPIALLWGPGGTMVYNQGYALIAGDRHPAALGASVLAVWPEVADFNRRNIATVLGGESVTYRDEALVLDRNGMAVAGWFDLDYSPVFDDVGQPIATIAVVLETTQHVLAARRLEDERARFVELFEQAPTFMAVLRGPEHRIELANPGYLRLVGRADVVGRTVADALPDAVAQGHVALLDQAFSTGKAIAGNGARYGLQAAADGAMTDRFVDFVYQPMKNAAGEVTGIFVEGVDVTGRIAAEAAARQTELRNRQILDSAVDYAIVAFDPQGKVTRWNEGARRILGWTEEEMLGHDGSRFFTPEDRAADRMQAEMDAARERGVGTDERWHLRKSGERFWANGEMTPIRGNDGVLVGFVKVLRDRTEQHRAAETLKESERRLHQAQAAGGVGTFSVDLATDRVFGTREFYRIFGVAEADSVPAELLESLVLPEDAAVRSDSARRRDQSSPLRVEYRIRRAGDGAVRWIARNAEFECDDQRRPVRLVGVVQDITDRRATQQALVASEAVFRTFAQSLPNHVWTAPPDGRLDWFNDRVYAYAGLSRDELQARGWGSLLHPDDLARATARWDVCVASGEQYETEHRILRADGAYRWHLVRALPLRDAEGAISRWIGTNTDIHQGKLAQVEITRDRDRIWTLSQELMLICDFGGRITAVNPTATRLLGWPADQMVGRTLSDFMHPDDLASTAAEVGKLSEGITTLAFENRYRIREGGYRLLSWTAVPDAGFIHAVARDVTRERATEEALRQSQKLEAIGQLTGGVAHDFNNVLAVIKTSIDLLRLVPLADDRRHRFMDSISNAVARATKLTGQLLAFARRQALQPVVFDAGHNTRAVSDMISSLAGSRVDIVVQMAHEACYVNADPSQFDTALVNLAVNARDAMNQSGRLTIEVSAVDAIPGLLAQPAVAGSFMAVSIADTGSGIAPEHLVQIFEPFFTTKGVGHGTGLGLSQVFGFAKQSGGDIRVESVVGEGSVFTLYLPRVARPGTETTEPAPEAGALVKGAGGCILVVEDNAELLVSVEHTLQELGYTTRGVSSAEAALAELQQDASRFVAVFTDVVMSGMSGVELGHAIRRVHGALPVVLSSGYSYVLAQDSDHGFVLLQKPYALDDLARVLHEAIDEARGGYRPRRRTTSPDISGITSAAAAERERLRQEALSALQIMDTAEESGYDDLARMASEFCQAPMAMVSLVDDRRQWFKARVGLQARETPKEQAFCAHAVAQPDQLMVVNDASLDERFAANPLVVGDPNIRFYAGAPLVTSDGHAVGTLCVLDRVPREMDARQLEVLQFLAKQVVERLEQRRDALHASDGPASDTPTHP